MEMGKKESKVKRWFSTKFVPAITKLGSQRHLASLRDAFGTLIPLTIAGSLGLIMNGIVFGGAGSGYVSLLGLIVKMVHPDMAWEEISAYLWEDNGFNKAMLVGTNLFAQLNTITIGMTSLWFAFTFGYFLSLTRNCKNPVIAGFASLIGFLATTMGNIGFFQGAEGLISALIFGIISTEMFLWLSNVRALYIKLPDGVPPSVSKSFAVFLPFMITVGTIALSNIVFVLPNVLGADLAVTKSAFTSFSGSETDWQIYFSQNVIERLGPIYGVDNELVLQLQDIWSGDGSAESKLNAIKTLYENSSTEDQGIIGAMISLMNGTISDKGEWAFAVDKATINNLYGDASLQFIDANGTLVLLSKYIQTSISGAAFGWSAAIYQFFVSSLLVFATGSGGLGLALAYAFFISFLWFFGVHGSNVVNGAFSPIWSMIGTINLTLITSLGYQAAAASGEMGVFSGQFFDTFMNLGGSGATLSLIIGTFVFSKRQDMRKIATYAAPSGIFQINEPVLFGYPIVLNAVYATPFILAPMVNVFVGWLFSPDVMNIVGYAQIGVPWTTPYLLASVIVYLSPKALIPALLVTGVSFAIYMPFIWLDNMSYFRKLKANFPEQYALEMKYYSDPRFKFQTITGNKHERLVDKAEVIINNAHSQNRFWEQKMTDKAKLEARKAKNVALAEIRNEYAVLEADLFKEIRVETEKVYDRKWDYVNSITAIKDKAKLDIKAAKDSGRMDEVVQIKQTAKENIMAKKADWKASADTNRAYVQDMKKQVAQVKLEAKQQLAQAKVSTKEKLNAAKAK
ncbi:PTS sugar transporter subunit IIC [Spiroplasma culicicola]|uniref:PTS system cellobiose-specific IIC component n=1 Tax=Spiroplasma culicicola AES-1 TaxID=1276246 RepID=W6A6F7_9MOLU|nr:PTS transporter subunit EIIC [Spiroplasma culicicola]AHI52582.1 PTS system cellobiose-specific IIC component [Spiroplasma culicicola AES-1]